MGEIHQVALFRYSVLGGSAFARTDPAERGCGIATQRRDPDTLARQRERDAPSDSLPGAGHDRDLARESRELRARGVAPHDRQLSASPRRSAGA